MPVTLAIGSRGFTLLELLVVLAILVLLASAWPLAAPQLFPAQQLRNEAEHLVNVLRATRTTARLTGQQQRVELTDGGDGYRSGSQVHALPHGATAQLRGADGALVGNAISFFPDGSSTGGVILLGLSNRTESVAVGPLTGRAEIQQ